jgi:hypothetical protein
MSNEPNHANHGSPSQDGYERRDIGIAGVLYFLLILAFAGILANFAVSALYSFLEKRNEAEQTSASPLVTGTPADTRHLPADSKKYLDANFPAPQLETDERTELNNERVREADTLSTYGWVDQNAGTVRIPIDRAMELLAQRGLPVRSQTEKAAAASAETPKSQPEKKKASKK